MVVLPNSLEALQMLVEDCFDYVPSPCLPDLTDLTFSLGGGVVQRTQSIGTFIQLLQFGGMDDIYVVILYHILVLTL